ncbi:hypothetical protein BDB00DRAFT_869244 [Zychaea mexicana]|uniref:uncharacterized protein n=1 Tax=Zychaea mexicana TaxID=64656 RepID=UPI0022FE44B2|nr:uncharacterized protein BDB00DRAFT_869244 [Zychaea mexicana]KAI9496666.1 hypothetical protein BDB00DRAFT_869244 [Zychaea mexicana]
MVPMKGTIWKTREMVTVRWSGVSDKNIGAITLAQPTDEGGYIDVAKVATEVPAGPGKYSLKLPANIAPNDNYVIILGNSEDAKCISGAFFIENGMDSGQPLAPGNPPAPGNEQQTPPSSAQIAPSDVGTAASAGVTNGPSSSVPASDSQMINTDSNAGRASRTAGHHAFKTGSTQSDANGIGLKGNELASYFVNLFLFLAVVIEIMTYL